MGQNYKTKTTKLNKIYVKGIILDEFFSHVKIYGFIFWCKNIRITI